MESQPHQTLSVSAGTLTLASCPDTTARENQQRAEAMLGRAGRATHSPAQGNTCPGRQAGCPSGATVYPSSIRLEPLNREPPTEHPGAARQLPGAQLPPPGPRGHMGV